MDNVINFSRRQGMDLRDHQQAVDATRLGKGWVAELMPSEDAESPPWIPLVPHRAEGNEREDDVAFAVLRDEGRVMLHRHRDGAAWQFSSVAEAVAAGTGVLA
jgi:hypothetical protein